METSIRVQIPVHGWTSFCLEFHLAYLTLRKVKPTSIGNATGVKHKSVDRVLLDLACLGSQSSSNDDISQHLIQEANVSVVVCGWSDTQWTGCAFVNTGIEVEEEEEEKEEEEYADDSETEEETENQFQQDFLAAENSFHYAVDANTPEWDARKYWLKVLSIRCQLVWKEWQYLVRTVEDAIETWKSSDLCFDSMNQSITDPGALRKSLDRTLQAIQLLRTLQDSLSMTLRAYRRFEESGGDKCYFSDMTGRYIASVHAEIKESFQKLADLHLRLGSLSASCTHISSHLGHVLDLEANRLTFESIQLNRENNALSMRSHDLTVESNELNTESHRLNRESNKLNLESNQLSKDSNKISMDNHDLSERAHKLNQRTSILSDKMREINELSMNAALANQAAAAKTSSSTRVSVEVGLRA
ncbi:hypothetical protein J4E82_003324 [Alternaria postmessia]|uniref:uncharacterized protein n=1 Tax=Alternaria postmessia TaxID=1187938 RepID=UPI0010D21B58|nr:uncharacterized protein J4E82_003324 [Alternaria postmessia]KAI5377944.1 hypothetical protein J4E82_003324 [Alternaria postmessia]RYN61403.1 hypothetical protein AA0118_g5730 [Alternaria tenuissima]